MGLLGNMASASGTLQGATNAVSLLGATKALITGPNTPPGITGPDLSVPGSLSSYFPAFLKNIFFKQTSYLFDVSLTDQVNLSAQVTDHYTETNYAIQDHVAINPVKISLTGIAAELVFSRSKLEKYVQQVLNTLTPLGILSPEQSASAQRYLSEVNRLQTSIENTFGAINETLGTLGFSSFGRNKQQRAYAVFEGWFNNRCLLQVETPWKTFDGMIIESFSFDQDETTKDMTTITVNFKQIRSVSTSAGIGQLKGRIMSQLSPSADKGVSKGTQSDSSILYGAFN